MTGTALYRRAGKFRRPGWLRKHRYGPNVFMFRNLETNQVLYTQLPFPQRYNIKKQFRGYNWQNRQPTERRDLWRPMAVAQLRSYESAVDLYDNLVQLRHMRDFTHKAQANEMRKKNKDGNIWYYSQFRPTYTQEAVADVISALEHLNLKSAATLHWEDEWRRGDPKHWQGIKAAHTEMPRVNPRDQFVALRQIADESYKSYFQNLAQINRERQQEYAEGVRQRLNFKPVEETVKVVREAPGGPSKRWPEKRLVRGINRKQGEISKLHSRAQRTKNVLDKLPVYANTNLRAKLRQIAKREYQVLRRVQRELERYKRARAAQIQLERLKQVRSK